MANPSLAPLTDPGTRDGRRNVMFYERAFWMFGTGHRLGDLRRLVKDALANRRGGGTRRRRDSAPELR